MVTLRLLTNEEFEVAFNTSNRNNNQQYALLFTPLAQQSMMALLMDEKEGYGDDFDFDKHYMINTIMPEHLQVLDLDMTPAQYRSFDFEKAKKDFYEINARYFVPSTLVLHLCCVYRCFSRYVHRRISTDMIWNRRVRFGNMRHWPTSGDRRIFSIQIV